MVVVSHDRHFLRATVDDYYLVANSAVEHFKGDLDDYSQWLNEQTSSIEDSCVVNSQADNAEAKDQKKQQRRAAAAQREQLKPLRNKIKKAEMAMQKVEQSLALINETLANPDIYQSKSAEQLKALFQQQGQQQNELEQLEAEWLELEAQYELLNQ